MTGEKELLLIRAKILLDKFPGKGGWTFAPLDTVEPSKNTPFGWIKVKGKIEDYSFSNYRIMPMGNGKLFLPVKASVRKKIKKEAGDIVHIELYKDEMTQDIPLELLDCFKDDPIAYNTFNKKTEGQQKALIEWIYDAKKEETKIERIAKMMNDLNGLT